MWVKDGNSAGCNNGEKLDWPSAMAFCEGLTYAGYSDWRLPSREELGGICDDGRHSGLFANTKTTFYWTASTDVPDTGKAWQVDFYSGINTEKTDNSYVCCVRTTSVSEPVKSETQKSEDVSLAKEDTVAP